MADTAETVWEQYAALELVTRTQTAALVASALALENIIRDASATVADQVLGESKKGSLIRDTWPLTTVHIKARMQSVAELVMMEIEQRERSPDDVPGAFESKKYYNEDLEAAYGNDNPRARFFLDLLAWSDGIAERCPVLLAVDMSDRWNVEVRIYPKTSETNAYLASSLSDQDYPALQFGSGFVTTFDEETQAFLRAARTGVE